MVMGSEKRPHFDNLTVEGWFWELVRRDGRFRKRFVQIEQAVRAYTASRLSKEEYTRLLNNYLAHLRRYGLRAVSLPDSEASAFGPDAYLFLPLPGKDRIIAVPRPDLAYCDFVDGFKPAPIGPDRPDAGLNRLRIRKLLAKYGLLEKENIP
ncbi:MAG: hypothetical protein ABSE25_02085 [Syntrophorhabdales bacterium]|jgi:hypothetical protein